MRNITIIINGSKHRFDGVETEKFTVKEKCLNPSSSIVALNPKDERVALARFNFK